MSVFTAQRTRLLTCLLIGALALSACSARFPGQLPSAPLWLNLTPDQLAAREEGALYGRGKAEGLKRISHRRAVAESNAIADLRARFERRLISLMQSGNSGERPVVPPQELSAVREMLKHLSWAQAARVEQRYFDAERNTQHALARLTINELERALSLDPSEPTVKAVLLEYARLTFKSLRP